VQRLGSDIAKTLVAGLHPAPLRVAIKYWFL